MPEQDHVHPAGRTVDHPLPLVHMHVLEEDLAWWFERERRNVIAGLETLLRHHADFDAWLADTGRAA